MKPAERPTQFISLDCKEGELTLALGGDGRFLLSLALWEEASQSHAARRVLTGDWAIDGETLRLSGNSAELQYQEGTVTVTLGDHEGNARAWRWLRSDQTTFADQFTLLEREAVERLIRASFPGGAPPGAPPAAPG